MYNKKTYDGKEYNYCVTCGIPLTEENFKREYHTPTCVKHEAAFQAEAVRIRQYGIHEQPYLSDTVNNYDCQSGAPRHAPASKYGPAIQAPPNPYL